MSAIKFPDNELLAELNESGRLQETLDAYAQVLVSHPDHSQVAQWCRKYLSRENGTKDFLKHASLRRAVYYVVFRQRFLVDSPVETYWDIVAHYAPTNETVMIEYLESAPRSVPLKLSRLLLYKIEFGDQRLKGDDFERAIIVLFSARNISDGVIGTEWIQKVRGLKTPAADVVAECAEYFRNGGPIQALNDLLPQYSSSKLFGLLKTTGLSVDRLTEHIFEDPTYVDSTLSASRMSNAKNGKPKKYINLDQKEKDAREDAVRRHNQKHFAYKYVSLEDEDPDFEEAPAIPELSEADRKLIAQEEILWDYWNNHREVFDRNSRKSELRKALSTRLKWTHEQIEGWGKFIGTKGREKDIQLEGNVNEVEAYAPAAKSAAQAPPLPSHSRPPMEADSKSIRSKAKSKQTAPKKDNAAKEKSSTSRSNRPKNSAKRNHSRKEE